MSVRAWLSLGSNVEPARNLRAAVRGLRVLFGPLVLSPVYRSEAVGFEGEPFLNMVVGIETDLTAAEVSAMLRRLEADQGRVGSADKFAPRTLDIDLLTLGDQVVDDGRLQLPRDEILEYAFVLRPLADVAGDELHPLRGASYRDLWAAFDQAHQPTRRVELALD